MKKAQYSTEFLIVIAVAVFLMIPMIYIFYNYSQSSIEQINNDMILRVGNEIIRSAEIVYYFGTPSHISFEAAMPEGLSDVYIRTDGGSYNELIIETISGEKHTFFSDVFINGSFDNASASEGKKTITCSAMDHESSGKLYVNVSIR